MLGTVSTFYDVDAVLIAASFPTMIIHNKHRSYQRSWCTFQVGITAGVTFALTVFAFQTKIDFTACGGCRHYCITIYHIVL